MTCFVKNCSNYDKKTRKMSPEKIISYHRFPKNKKLLDEWIKICQPTKTLTERSIVCSEHFCNEDFEIDFGARLVNLPERRKLISTAVPSLRLPESNDSSTGSKTSEQHSEKTINNVQSEIELKAKARQLNQINQLIEVIAGFKNNLNEQIMATQQQKDKNKDIIIKNEQLTEKIAFLRGELSSQNKEIKKLQQEIEELKKTSCKEHFTSLLSQNQLDILTRSKKTVRWTNDDIAKAFTIRYFSKRCYTYLRSTLNYPLPALKTLKKWAYKTQLRGGLLASVLRMMEISGQSMKDLDRCTVLLVDDVEIKSPFEYDSVYDQVVGPFNYMQVVMARGLFTPWKQPVYVNFDEKMTPGVLSNIISSLHEIKYNVVSCVSDCGGDNVSLWKELGVDTVHPYIKHPATNANIYFFPDAPSLLILLRNKLVENGFILQNGDAIHVKPIRYLLQEINNVSHEISFEHLAVVDTERQKIGLAAQLLSHNTATALLHYLPGPDKKLAENTGLFIEIIWRWFQLMNSNTTNPSLPQNAPYGMHLDNQKEVLNVMYNMVENMKCAKKRLMQTVQTSILMSIKSLQLLYDDMKNKYQIKYILTRRLNQDTLRNFFSQLGGRGANDDQTHLSALYYMRMSILGKNPESVQGENTSGETEDEYFIVKDFLSKAKVTIPNSVLPSPSEMEDTESPLPSSSAQISSEPSQNEDDGLGKLTLWIVDKFKNTYPSLVNVTHEEVHEHSYAVGGLTTSSASFLNNIKSLNKIFKGFHRGNKFKKGKNMIKNLVSIAQKEILNLPEEIIHEFMLQRMFLRIRYLNKHHPQSWGTLKRKNKDTDGQSTKRMKKPTTNPPLP